MKFTFIISYVVSLLLHVSSTGSINTPAGNQSITRILLMGDSVDRYSVEDWCRKYSGNIITDRSDDGTIFNKSLTLDSLLKFYPRRSRSWELRICDAVSSRNVILAFIFNKIGVKAQPPWHCPIMTTSGLESISFSNVSLLEALTLAVSPGLGILNTMLAENPNGILINSVFWDLSHPDPGNFRNNESTWIRSWSNNITSLMNFMTAEYKDAVWFGWRAGNKFKTVGESEHWNTRHALQLLNAMNSLSKDVAARNGYDWLEFPSDVRLHDNIHPAPPATVRLIESVVERTQRAMRVG